MTVSGVSLPVFDALRFGDKERRHTHFSVTLGEAVEEAVHNLQGFLASQPSSSSTTASSSSSSASSSSSSSSSLSPVAVQHLSSTRAAWELDAATHSRTMSSGLQWNVHGHNSTDYFHAEDWTTHTTTTAAAAATTTTPMAFIGTTDSTSDVSARELNVERVPPFAVPLVACALSGERAHALSAVACWAALAAAATALLSSNADYRPSNSSSSSQRGASASVDTASVVVGGCGMRLASGLQSAVVWLFGCLHSSLSAHGSTRLALRHERRQWQEAAQAAVRAQQHKASRLADALHGERRAAQAAAAAARAQVDQAVEREQRTAQQLAESERGAEATSRQLQAAQTEAHEARQARDAAARKNESLRARLQAVQSDNQSLRAQADDLGRTVADLAGDAGKRGTDAQDLQAAYDDLKRRANARAAQLEVRRCGVVRRTGLGGVPCAGHVSLIV